ncbi:MAG: hypothetical protein AUJ75_02575 [Candidatus Omnitrophica bacterium CG1_02_49_10]|nr:MAG: hypothetical protein AUJ75_02575 [Candidatus Omnitrophica bacterium CG1_02_49_10]
MDKKNFEIRVGLFVFIAMIILTVIVFSVGNFYIFKPGYTINVIFGFAGGLEEGAPVRLAGYDVGEVRQMTIFYDEEAKKTKIEAVLWVKKEANIEKNCEIYVNTLGLLGEKYVEILPGTKDSGFVAPGNTLIGVDPVPMEKLTAMGHRIAVKLNEIVGDEETIKSFKDSISNMSSLTSDVSEIVSDKKENIKKIMDNAKDATEKLNVLLENFDAFIVELKENPWKLLSKPKKSKKKDK